MKVFSKKMMVLAVGLCLLLWSVPVMAAELSADMVVSSGGIKTQGKMYIKDQKIRSEMEMPGMPGAGKVVSIVNMETNVFWLINDADKSYLEMSDAMEAVPPTKEKLEELAQVKKLGKESVNGFDCEKVEYVFHDKNMGTMIQWQAIKLDGYPIKTETKGPGGNAVTELKNIKTGGVSNSLFEIPAGYTKTEMPKMPGNMPFKMGD